MPQLDISTFASQLFWLLVMFVVLYVLLSRVAMPRIAAVLGERQRRVDDNLEKATKLKAEVEAAVAAYEKTLAEARAQAQNILREAAEEAARRSDERQHELADRVSAQIKAAEDRIAVSKGEAMAQIRNVASDLARSAAERLAGIQVDESRAAAAVAFVTDGKH